MRAKRAVAQGRSYLGPIYLSKLVGTMAAHVYSEISALLSDNNRDDPDVWGSVWEALPAPRDDNWPRVLELILTTVSKSACTWWFRFVQRCESFPLVLLAILDAKLDVADPRRMEIAARLLAMTNKDFRLMWASDVSEKILNLFRAEFESMKLDGRCDRVLYNFLFIFRSVCPGDTQDIEGLNSQLQWLVNLARAMERPSADARICIRNATMADADEYAQLHSRTLCFMESDTHIMRYAPVPVGPGPDIPRPIALQPEVPEGALLSELFMRSAKRQIDLSRGHVCFLGKVAKPGLCLLLPWSYYSKVFCISATARILGGRWVCYLGMPLRVRFFCRV